MANVGNVDQPNGFTVHGPLLRENRYYKDTTANTVIAVGDPVIRVTNSSSPDGYPEIVRATTGAAITGVVTRVEPIRSDLNQHGYLSSSQVGYVYVADHPQQEFLVQDNGGATGIIVTNIGQHVDSVTALDGSTVLGRSKYEIDTEAIASDNTWRIERLYDAPGNAVGDNAKWIVKPNLHTEVNASATTLTEV